MKLPIYLEHSSAAELARALGVTPSSVAQFASGGRPVPIKRCVQIEAATRGRVTRKDLRDDWREIWPELEAIERAAGAIRAGHRFSKRTAAVGVLLQPPGSRYRVRLRHNRKISPFDDLLLLSVSRRAEAGHPRFRKFRL